MAANRRPTARQGRCAGSTFVAVAISGWIIGGRPALSGGRRNHSRNEQLPNCAIGFVDRMCGRLTPQPVEGWISGSLFGAPLLSKAAVADILQGLPHPVAECGT